MKANRLVCGLVFVIAIHALAAEPPLPPAARERMLAGLSQKIAALNQAIELSPRDVPLYSRRGDAHLFLGHFTEALADFEKMIALDPAQDAPHWRLGIAYYFAGQFAKSARQFEKYHGYDGGDRENGIWKFLGDVKAHGLERARRGMLVYTRFDREPFPDLYEMFAGRKTSEALFAGIRERHLADESRVMFFAHYYAGLHEEILGHRQQAITLLREAVANTWGQTAENGPAYMWQVARLHYEMLSAAKR